MISISRGATAAASFSRGEARQFAAQRVGGLVAVLERDERLDDLHCDGVGLADDAGLGDGGCSDERGLNLEGADEVGRRC